MFDQPQSPIQEESVTLGRKIYEKVSQTEYFILQFEPLKISADND